MKRSERRKKFGGLRTGRAIKSCAGCGRTVSQRHTSSCGHASIRSKANDGSTRYPEMNVDQR